MDPTPAPTLSASEDYCFSNLSDSITISSWYIAQIVFLMSFFVAAILFLVLIEANRLHVVWFDRFKAAVELFSLVFVFCALIRNLSVFVNQSAIPLCGLEDIPSCTALTGSITSTFFKFFAATNFTFAIIATILGEVSKRFAARLINYRPVPFGFSGAYLMSLLKKIATVVVEKIIMLVTVIFSPGMVLLEVMPYNDNCIQDRNLKIILYHAVTHGSIFIVVLVAPLLDLCKQERDFKLTLAAVGIFVLSGFIMFFIQIFASASEPAMWSLWSFSVAYPTLIGLSQKLPDAIETLGVALFAMHSASSFPKKPPLWSLAARIEIYEARRAELGKGPVTFSEAFESLRGCLDRFYAPLDVEALQQSARLELSERGIRLPKRTANDALSGSSGSGGDNAEREEEDELLMLLAWTTILQPREGRCLDVFVRRVQLFDRLHDVLEDAMHGEVSDWGTVLEVRLMPMLSLLARALRRLPVKHPASSGPALGWLASTEDVDRTYLLMRRFSHHEVVRCWFEDHLGAPSKDPLSPRGEAVLPVVFRSFVWGYTEQSKVMSLAGVNDAVLAVRPSSALDDVAVPALTVWDRMHVLGDYASSSWFADGRGDVVYCPGASYAVGSFCPVTEVHDNIAKPAEDGTMNGAPSAKASEGRVTGPMWIELLADAPEIPDANQDEVIALGPTSVAKSAERALQDLKGSLSISTKLFS